MKFRNIFWGMLLILLGVLFILQNFNVIDIQWYGLWQLWPAFLILWGVSILPTNNWVKTILVAIVLTASAYLMVNKPVEKDLGWMHRHFDKDYSYDDEEESYDYDDENVSQDFYIAYEDSVSSAIINFDMAAGSFYIQDTTNYLLNFSKTGDLGEYTYNIKRTGDKAKINIKRAGEELFRNDHHKDHRVNLTLNQQPVWSLNLDVGAAKVDFDLTRFKVKKIDMDGGAASIKLKLGNHVPKSYVNIDAGASQIILKIPHDAGCDLHLNSVLSGKTITGFEKIDGGHYRTDNFDTAENKIFITMDAAVSSYTITRY
jgi:hypothetical protein